MKSTPWIGLRLVGFLLLAGSLMTPPVASAYVAGGGKDADKGNDCLIGYNGVDPGQVKTEGKKQVFSCTDCDPTCDKDGVTEANGTCTFELGACINHPDVTGCTPPAGLTKAKASAKVQGVKGKIVIDVPQLLEGPVCGEPLEIDVATKKNNTKDGKGKVSLSAQLKKDKDAGIDKTRKDTDKLTIVCSPRPTDEACPLPTTTTTSSSTSTSSTTSTTGTVSTTSTTVATTSTTSTTLVTTTSTTLASTTSTTLVSTTSTTLETTTSTTTTVVTTTTSTTNPTGTVLRFTTGAPVGACGAVKTGGANGTLLKALSCGGLNVGGGGSTVAEGPTPANAETQLNTACVGTTCTVSARTAAQTGSTKNCSDTGCAFGPYLPITNLGTSTCVRNTFEFPASGTLDSSTGTFDGGFPLLSTVYLTGNATFPCPLCIGGTPGVTNSGTCQNASQWASGVGPSPDAGAVCTPVNAGRDSHDCDPPPGSLLPSFSVDLTPITTGTATATGPLFCPMQSAPGGAFSCNGSATALCPGGAAGVADYIDENGTAAGTLTAGTHPATLVSTFCIPSVGGQLGFLINGAANLPGPGATSLPGTLELVP